MIFLLKIYFFNIFGCISEYSIISSILESDEFSILEVKY